MKESAEVSDPDVRTPDHKRPTLRLALRSMPPESTAGPLAALESKRLQDAGLQASEQLLALAELMESWALALPRWDNQVTEPWFVFLDRAYKAETDLAERLRRLPTCRLFMCPIRQQVSLTLADISISTDKGLASACRGWARNARAQGSS